MGTELKQRMAEAGARAHERIAKKIHLMTTAHQLFQWGDFTQSEYDQVVLMLGNEQDFIMGETIIKAKEV